MLTTLFFLNNALVAQGVINSHHSSVWPKSVFERIRDIWMHGDNELYLTGYAWHNRYTYPREKLKSYNEIALGGGLGKGFYDNDGDWHGLYSFAFLDSHKNIQPVVGYSFLKVSNLNDLWRFGVGATVFITSRADIFHRIPFPGALPWISLNYQRATLSATYIPGSRGAGNVLFLVAKCTL